MKTLLVLLCAIEAQPSIWEHLHPLDLAGITLRALPVFYSFLGCRVLCRMIQSTSSSSVVVNKMSSLAPAANLLCCVGGMTI